MRWAIYRIHYGLDFLKVSINSIYPYVDKIFIGYSLEPWSKKSKVNYLGKEIDMPKLHEKVDKWLEENYGNDSKIKLFNYETNTPKNQFKIYLDHCINNEQIIPNTTLFIEPDMVFEGNSVHRHFNILESLKENSKIQSIGMYQIEVWKYLNWRIPLRPRIGPVIFNTGRTQDFSTGFGTTGNLPIGVSDLKTYNFGFCFNPKTMLYKILASINFSKEIGDSIPSHEWYEEKWLNWNPSKIDLEISERHKNAIQKAIPHTMPENIIEALKYSSYSLQEYNK